MALGAFAPMPLRLGGNALEGLTAAQHARLVADLAAAKRVAPLCVLTWVHNSFAANIVVDYLGMNGAGAAFAPTLSNGASDDVTFITLPTWTDPYGISSKPRVTMVTGIAAQSVSAKLHATMDGTVIIVSVFNAAGVSLSAYTATVALW